MTARVIDLLGRRGPNVSTRIVEEAAFSDARAARKRVLELLAENRTRPVIEPDDPIIALWEAYKEAKATYDVALSEMARRFDVPKINMAAILRSVCQKRKTKVGADLHDLPEGVLPI
jgi:hypothetical protein